MWQTISNGDLKGRLTLQGTEVGGGGGRSEESLFFLEKTVLGIVKRVNTYGYGVWDLGWVTDKNLHQKNMR